MREFQEKKRWRKYVYSKGAVIVLVLLVIYFARAAFTVYMKEQASAQNARDSAENLAKLQERQAVLASGISSLNTTEGVDAQIRSEYSVEKPGEHMIIIVNPDDSTTTATSTPPQSFWQKIFSFFKW